MEPTDIVFASIDSVNHIAIDGSRVGGASDPGVASSGTQVVLVSCTVPLAVTCRTLRDLLLRGGVRGAPPLIHRIIMNGFLGEACAQAALQCLPGGSDPRISLRLAATWARLHRGHRIAEHQPRPIGLQPVVASTTDHDYETIQQTVKAPSNNAFRRAEYWSSVSQNADTRDFLVYRLPGLCALSSVRIKAYAEMGVVFSWPRVRLHVFASLPSPTEEPALFRTAELFAVDTSKYQEISFAQPVLGRYLLIELIGKNRQQHSETGWFVCVDHVTVSGFQVLQAGPAVSPPPLPAACHTATLLRPTVRRVQVLGYSQERMLYGTTDIGAAASHFHPENAPKPKFVPPNDIEFSAEGEAARNLVEEWLGKEARTARTHKVAGGEAFKRDDFDGAIQSYTQALQSLWPGFRSQSSRSNGSLPTVVTTKVDEASAETSGGLTADEWAHHASGLHWVCGTPALHTDLLATTLLSNLAESRLRAADQTATALRHSVQAGHERVEQQSNGAAPRDGDGHKSAESPSLSPTVLQRRLDEHFTTALADAAAALDLGMDGGVGADGNNINDKSRRRLAKAAQLIAASQAARLGDSIRPRSNEQIANGSLGGCTDKVKLEAAIGRTWEAPTRRHPIEVEATCVCMSA